MAEVLGDQPRVAELLPRPGRGGVAERVGGDVLLEAGALRGALDDRRPFAAPDEQRRRGGVELEVAPVETPELGAAEAGRDERDQGEPVAPQRFNRPPSGVGVRGSRSTTPSSGRSGVDKRKRVTPHTLRQVFASELLRAGANLRQVQELLEDKHLDSTQLYTRVTAHELRGAVKRLRWVG